MRVESRGTVKTTSIINIKKILWCLDKPLKRSQHGGPHLSFVEQNLIYDVVFRWSYVIVCFSATILPMSLHYQLKLIEDYYTLNVMYSIFIINNQLSSQILDIDIDIDIDAIKF